MYAFKVITEVAEQNTNTIRCDFCGENIAKGGNKKWSSYSGRTKDIFYKPIQLPFKCHRCNGTFCVDHRLPESHFCTGLYREHTRYSIDKKTRILIAIMIAILIALYIILFVY
ncbi:MAG: AN1-type zinc finger domain-containing protein [Methanosarcinaceae archaeon]